LPERALGIFHNLTVDCLAAREAPGQSKELIMRKVFASIAFLLALVPAVTHAQGFTPAGAPAYVLADNFGRWALQGQGANVYTFQVSGLSPCQITKLNYGDSQTFYAFSNTNALAPVFIADVNGSLSEVVTPGSFLAPTQSSCGPALAPANNHTTFTEQSGTGGLQEALNSVGTRTILLSKEWYALLSGISSMNATLSSSVSPASVIGNAACATGQTVVDITTSQWTFFACSGGHLVASNLPAYAPSIAASTGAGTGPTIAVVSGSTAYSGTVTLTTGTGPAASAEIFALTFPTQAKGGFNYAPSCTFTSIGTPAYTGVTTSSAGSGTPTATYTATATALAASQAGYAWTYSCH
jgi:hypothetical protein